MLNNLWIIIESKSVRKPREHEMTQGEDLILSLEIFFKFSKKSFPRGKTTIQRTVKLFEFWISRIPWEDEIYDIPHCVSCPGSDFETCFLMAIH